MKISPNIFSPRFCFFIGFALDLETQCSHYLRGIIVIQHSIKTTLSSHSGANETRTSDWATTINNIKKYYCTVTFVHSKFLDKGVFVLLSNSAKIYCLDVPAPVFQIYISSFIFASVFLCLCLSILIQLSLIYNLLGNLLVPTLSPTPVAHTPSLSPALLNL